MRLLCAIPRQRTISVAVACVIAASGLVLAAPAAWAAGPPTDVSTSLAFGDVGPTTYSGFTGSLNPNGLETTYYFQYGRTLNYGGRSPGTPRSVGSGTTDTLVASPSLTGLLPANAYHYRLVAANTAGTAYSDDKTFTTCGADGCAAPTVAAEAVDSVTSSSATLNADVNPNGGSYTTCYFTYSTDPTVTSGLLTTPGVNVGHDNLSLPVSAGVAALTPATTYYAFAACQNDIDETQGPVVSFTTAPSTPVVATGTATRVTSTHATLAATVSNDRADLSCRFDYGKSIRYGGQTAQVFEASRAYAGSFSGVPSRLATGTTYHYRAKCSSGATVFTGADRTFVTRAATN